MFGCFGVPPSVSLESLTDSLVSRLKILVGRFQKLEKESFCHGIRQAFTIVMSHYEGGSSWRS